ncbi:MAG: sugar ABC transporter permease [Desulfurococcaceae archaeon]
MNGRILRPYLFLLPALILVSVFVLYPIIYTTILSFIDKKSSSFTLDNYISVLTTTSPVKAILPRSFSSTPPWGALIHNLLWMAIHVPVITIGGLILAYLLKFYVKGGTLVKAVMFLGMVIPPAVGGLLTMFMFSERIGVFPMIFSYLGFNNLSKSWLLYRDLALWGLILGSIWLWMGFAVTVLSAGLEAIPQSHVDAAKVFGASSWIIFWRIIIPELKPVILVVVVMTALWDMKIFDFVWGSTKGGPLGASNVLAVIMYDYFVRDIDYYKASTVAVLLTIFTTPIILLAIRRLRE